MHFLSGRVLAFNPPPRLARAGVNRGISARHAPLNCGLYC